MKEAILNAIRSFEAMEDPTFSHAEQLARHVELALIKHESNKPPKDYDYKAHAESFAAFVRSEASRSDDPLEVIVGFMRLKERQYSNLWFRRQIVKIQGRVAQQEYVAHRFGVREGATFRDSTGEYKVVSIELGNVQADFLETLHGVTLNVNWRLTGRPNDWSKRTKRYPLYERTQIELFTGD